MRYVRRSVGPLPAVGLFVFLLSAPPSAHARRGPSDGTPAILESGQAWSGSFESALFGAAVASAGDLDGDGFDDLVVGAPGYDHPGGAFDVGAVFVFAGRRTGLAGLGPADAQALIFGPSSNSEFGASVDAAGDVNGDGYDDLVVGAPLASPGGLVSAGAAYVFLGGPGGLRASTSAQADFVLVSDQSQAFFGQDVAGAGDVNADGYADLIVGAPLYGRPFDPPLPGQGSGAFGSAFVFLGSPAGPLGAGPATCHAWLRPWADGWPSQGQAHMGTDTDGAGDVNGDGYDDVVVGVPWWNNDRPWPGLDGDDPFQEGAAFVFLGGPDGVVGRDPSDAHARLEGGALEAHFGAAVAGAGDVNGDGYADLVLGAPGAPAGDPLLGSEEGAAFVFLGGEAGITAHGPDDAQATFTGSGLAAWLGRCVAGGFDLDGDGYDEIVLGARSFPRAISDDADYNGSRRLTGEGRAVVFRGGPDGIGSRPLVSIESCQEAGSAGFDVAFAGDLDGDGLSDLVIGVPGWSGGELREGAAFLWTSRPVDSTPGFDDLDPLRRP